MPWIMPRLIIDYVMSYTMVQSQFLWPPFFVLRIYQIYTVLKYHLPLGLVPLMLPHDELGISIAAFDMAMRRLYMRRTSVPKC